MKLLVVDDDPDLLALVAFALTNAGYAVVKAADTAEALRVFDAELPNLVVLDINLPSGSGFDVCKAIRARSEVPVMMLTARGEEEDLVRALDRRGTGVERAEARLQVATGVVGAVRLVPGGEESAVRGRRRFRGRADRDPVRAEPFERQNVRSGAGFPARRCRAGRRASGARPPARRRGAICPRRSPAG